MCINGLIGYARLAGGLSENSIFREDITRARATTVRDAVRLSTGMRSRSRIMTDELKPVRCGCGGEAEVITIHKYDGDVVYYVVCMECRIETPEVYTEAEAIQAWNRAMGNRMELQTVGRTAKVEVNKHPCGISGVCCNCGGDVYNDDPYCSHCGCRLEWE